MRTGRPIGSKDRATPARPFALRFDGVGWRIQQGSSWRHAREVSVLAPVLTAENGILRGHGVVTRTGRQTFAVTP